MEEKKPLHSKSGAVVIMTKNAINASSTDSHIFKVCAKFFCDLNHYRKVPNHYRKVLNHYRKVLNPYRKVLNPYRKVLNHYRKLPVEGCYGRGEFLMKI